MRNLAFEAVLNGNRGVNIRSLAGWHHGGKEQREMCHLAPGRNGRRNEVTFFGYIYLALTVVEEHRLSLLIKWADVQRERVVREGQDGERENVPKPFETKIN